MWNIMDWTGAGNMVLDRGMIVTLVALPMMNMVFMMLDVMFLYKKGNEKMSLAEQYRGINMVSESILKWAQANAPGLLTMRGV